MISPFVWGAADLSHFHLPFVISPKKGEDFGEEREWAIAPPQLLPNIYDESDEKKDISFLFFLSLFFGGGGWGKECNRWRRSDSHIPPHPHIPQPHFLNHPPPQKKPSRYGIRIYESAGINFEA